MYDAQASYKVLIMYLIALILLIVALAYSVVIGHPMVDLLNVFDIPSLLIILLITIPMLLASGLFPDLRRAFRAIMDKKVSYSSLELQKSLEAVKLTVRLIVFSGIFGSLTGLINVLKYLSDPQALGPNLSVLLICTVYALFGSFLFMPISARLKVMLLSLNEES
jgi:flagellar motor component MotA